MKTGFQTSYKFSQLLLPNNLTYVFCVVCSCRCLFFFCLLCVLGICVEVDVDRITILLPLLPIFFPYPQFFL